MNKYSTFATFGKQLIKNRRYKLVINQSFHPTKQYLLIKMVKTLKNCHLDCKNNAHSIKESFILSSNLDNTNQTMAQTKMISLAMQKAQLEDEVQFYDINLELQICKKKWQILANSISKDKYVILDLQNVNKDNLKYDFSIIMQKNVIGIIIGFHLTFSKCEFKQLNSLMSAIQANKSFLFFDFNYGQRYQSDYKLPLQTIFSQVKSGSLISLEQLNINTQSEYVDSPIILSFEKALIDPSQSRGNLRDLTLELFIDSFNRNYNKSVAKIISFNKYTLKSITIQQKISIEEDSEVNINQEINLLGNALSELRQLEDIKIQIENEEQTDFPIINLNRLMEGIQKSQGEYPRSIDLAFEGVCPTASSNIGRSLSKFSVVKYSGPLQIGLASEIGIELGKSKILRFLQISSQDMELGVLLTYVLRFSTTIKDLNINYDGKKEICLQSLVNALSVSNTLETLSLSFSESTHKKNFDLFSAICKSISSLPNLYDLDLSFFEFVFQDINDFYSILNSLSNSKSLRMITISISYLTVKSILNPDLIALPFYSIPHLQKLYLSLRVYQLPIAFSAKLLSNLIANTNAHMISIGENSVDIDDEVEEIANDYSISFEQQMYFLISFDKVISQHLEYLPLRHIFDLYF